MISNKGDAILVDFGVSACFENEDDSVSRTQGTIRYFAPEIVRTGAKKEIHAKRTDIWALGVTFFNMATKKFPFPASSVTGIQSQILNEEPDFDLIKDVLLINLISLMLKKDQNERITIQ